MKAISIKEPYASMIRDGKKTIETRTWKTNHRGPLLICASLKPKTKNSGFAIAITNLIDCRPMDPVDERQACCEFVPDAFSWQLHNTKKIYPFPIKGKLGLFNFDLGNKGLVYYPISCTIQEK